MLEDEDILEHFGIKGMKWGIRRKSGPTGDASSDARTASDAIAKIKKHGGTHTLSNAELKAAVDRMNLEQQYSRLNPKKQNAGAKFAIDIVQQVGKQQLVGLANKQLSAAIEAQLKK